MYARKLGMQTNNITGLEVVTADGSIRVGERHRERRAVLGAARWRRQLRDRHRARVHHLPVPGRLRRDAGLGPHRDRAGAAPLGAVGRRRTGRGDHVVPGAEPAAAAGHPGSLPRPPAGDHRRRRAGLRRAQRRDPRRAAGAEARGRHVRPGAGAGAGPAAHGSGGPDARVSRTPRCWTGCRRRPSRRSSSTPARVRRPPCWSTSSGNWAARWAVRTRAPARCRWCAARSSRSACGDRRDPGDGRRRSAGRRRVRSRAGAVRLRSAVPELRRAHRSTRAPATTR